MFRNHLKIALRNLIRNKTFSGINIAGLAVGLAACIVILLWIQFETSYNRFHKNYDRLHQVMENQTYGSGEVFTVSATPPPLAKALTDEFPAVASATRVSWGDMRIFHYNEKHIDEFGLYVDPAFLRMFSFPLLKGDAATALTAPNTLLLSESTARKYFGGVDPVGKMIKVNEDQLYQVVGVFGDVPKASTLKFDFLMPAADYVKQYIDNQELWNSNNMRTFVQLKDGADPAALTTVIKDYVAKKEKDQANVELLLHPAKDWHLRSTFKNGKNAGGRIGYVRLFGAIAFFILLLACINFMNLSTAQAARRSKEVGVRKVMGGDKVSLMRQFLGESVIITTIAALLALALVAAVLPPLNQLLGKELRLPLNVPLYWILFALLILITGFVAGSYPALVLSSFQPAKVLKGAVDSVHGRNYWLRKSLVVVQFVVSVVMIIGSVVVYQQIQFVKNKNLGYNRNNLVYFPAGGIQEKDYDAFKQKLLAVSGVENVTRSSIVFTGSNNTTGDVKWEGKRDEKEVLFNIINIDFDMLNTFGIDLKEGRNFSKDFSTDTANYIINEEAARRRNLKEPIAGQEISLWDRKGKIVGVAKDFHISSVHGAIEPVILVPRFWTWTYFVRIDGQQTASVLKKIEEVYHGQVPDWPFMVHFMDKEYEAMYKSEMQVGALSKWFAGLAILISCLGLFGLVSLAAVQRTKEIGIRKVLGASVSNILRLLSKDFLALVAIASLIAFPLAWWGMNNWLQDFAYRITIGWWVFALAAAAVLLVALITIGVQAVKAALSNPVKNLRTE